jgi:hypothetical protein
LERFKRLGAFKHLEAFLAPKSVSSDVERLKRLGHSWSVSSALERSSTWVRSSVLKRSGAWGAFSNALERFYAPSSVFKEPGAFKASSSVEMGETLKRVFGYIFCLYRGQGGSSQHTTALTSW